MQNVIEKIRKVLARADETRNDNAHERAIAMRQASALLAKHGLSMADVTDTTGVSDSFGPKGKIEISLGRAVWRVVVFDSIARLNGCMVINSSTRHGQTVYLIGRSMRVTAARAMANYVVASIEREGKTFAKQSGVHGNRAITTFGNGAATGVRQQVEEILQQQYAGDIDGEKLSTERALVVTNQHRNAIKEANFLAREIFGNQLKSRTYRHDKGAGYSEGLEYGRNIGLNSQISGKSQPRLN